MPRTPILGNSNIAELYTYDSRPRDEYFNQFPTYVSLTIQISFDLPLSGLAGKTLGAKPWLEKLCDCDNVTVVVSITSSQFIFDSSRGLGTHVGLLSQSFQFSCVYRIRKYLNPEKNL